MKQQAETKSVETRDLKPGDVLAYTYAKVMSVPAYIGSGSGKVDFVVKTKDGQLVQKSWNRHRLVSIVK